MTNQVKTSLPASPSEEIKNGDKLIGCDFDPAQLELWYQQEQEAFFENDAGNGIVDPWYTYMRHVNEKLGFSHVEAVMPSPKGLLVLGPGPGLEVDLFHQRHPDCELFFLESSHNFQQQLKEKFLNSMIIEPKSSGEMSLPDQKVDIVTAFSVLHHIPNVDKIFTEVSRVLRPGGFFIVREPCSSMGMWATVRSATPNERGIAKKLMLRFANENGFHNFRAPVPILYEPINKIMKKLVGNHFPPMTFIYMIDTILSSLMKNNDKYWRDNFYKKLAPSSFFYVFRKNL